MENIEDNILIIVPTLNSYKLLPTLVNSLESQTYQFWKLLFIDGNSNEMHRNWLDSCCKKDSRCVWINQKNISSGIFGAMNQGISLAKSNEWILFWGSDDWAPSPNILSELILIIKEARNVNKEYDFICGKGRYINKKKKRKTRTSYLINSERSINSKLFQKLLFTGLIPPHQATLIGPKAREKLSFYDDNFKLSADLNYFLKLSIFENLMIKSSLKEVVFMGDEGISGKKTLERLFEVFKAYKNAFKNLWIIPFIFRYIRKIIMKLKL